MKIEEINITELHLFRENPFKVRKDDAFDSLVESISIDGIYEPLIVCPDKDESGYIIVSGQRRFEAAKAAGLKTVPAVVHDMDKDKMIIAIVDNNICSRDILPSEKAFGYKMKLEAMKRMPGRPSKENGAPAVPDLSGQKSRDILADDVGESREQIRRYIRLTELTPELLQLVDEGRMKLRPAVEISYLTEDEQRDLLDAIDETEATPSHAQAIRMRKLSSEGNLTTETINSIMCEEKPNQKEKPMFRDKRIAQAIPKNIPPEKHCDYVLKAIDYYNRHRQRSRDAR